MIADCLCSLQFSHLVFTYDFHFALKRFTKKFHKMRGWQLKKGASGGGGGQKILENSLIWVVHNKILLGVKNFKKYNLTRTRTHTYVYKSGGKKYSFFGKFGVLWFLETPVFRFTFLRYYQLTLNWSIYPVNYPSLLITVIL